MANEKIVNRENLKAFRQANDQRYKDGQVVVGKSLQTKSIEAVSEESGAIQDTPFIYQGTGTANGTASVDTSPVGKQLEKQGNSVVVNQLNDDGDGSVTTAQNDTRYIGNFNLINGHKYLIFFNLDTNASGLNLEFGGITQSYTWDILAYNLLNNTNAGFKSFLYTATANSNYRSIRLFNQTGGDITTSKVRVIDLTQWFGSNDSIPSDLTTNPSNFYRYCNGSLAYNTGTLINCDGRYLVCGGRNVWDEVSKLGNLNTTTGAEESANNRLISTNFIKVNPNTQYYSPYSNNRQIQPFYYDINKNYISNGQFVSQTSGLFTTPSNCEYIKFRLASDYGTTYNHNITISLYYTTGDGYDQYYPYEEPKVYDTGTETLRSAGSVRDYKTPDGTIHRLVGVVDLGTLNWTYDSTYSRWYSDQISSLIKYSVDNNTAGNLFSSLYENVSANLLLGATGMLISVNNGGRISVKNGSSTTQPSGTLNYELATPTTEQGTPFSENIEINDYGTMGWLDTNNAYVDIPQGCKIFYPADYVLFIDSLGQREDIDWDASEIVSQSELSASETQRDSVDTQLNNAVGGTLRQLLAQKLSISFLNTIVIDLSTIDWIYNTSEQVFYSTNATGKKVGVQNLICTKYATRASSANDNWDLQNNECGGAFNANEYLYIKDTNYTDATLLKASLKGVLLAYEKASS